MSWKRLRRRCISSDGPASQQQKGFKPRNRRANYTQLSSLGASSSTRMHITAASGNLAEQDFSYAASPHQHPLFITHWTEQKRRESAKGGIPKKVNHLFLSPRQRRIWEMECQEIAPENLKQFHYHNWILYNIQWNDKQPHIHKARPRSMKLVWSTIARREAVYKHLDSWRFP